MQRLARRTKARGTGLPFPFLSLGSLKGTSFPSRTEGKEGSLGKNRSPTPDRRGRIDARDKIARSWRKSSMGWEVGKRARKTCAMQAVERQTFQGSSGCNGGGEEGARLGRHTRESNAMQSQEDGKVRPRRILTRVGKSSVLRAMGLLCSIRSTAHHPLGSMGWAFHRNVRRIPTHAPRTAEVDGLLRGTSDLQPSSSSFWSSSDGTPARPRGRALVFFVPSFAFRVHRSCGSGLFFSLFLYSWYWHFSYRCLSRSHFHGR